MPKIGSGKCTACGGTGELTASDWEPVSRFMNSEVRTKRKKTVWWVHHSTKANFNNKKPTKLQDLYGSTFIARDMSSVLSLWKISNDEIEVLRAKGRTKQTWTSFLMRRNQNDLSFSVSSRGVSNS